MALVNTVVKELEETIKRCNYVGSCATVSVSSKTASCYLSGEGGAKLCPACN